MDSALTERALTEKSVISIIVSTVSGVMMSDRVTIISVVTVNGSSNDF